jgi:signal peptide peptidase SppA
MINKILNKLHVPGFHQPKPVVAVVRLAGVIGQGGNPVKPGLNAASLIRPIERAFGMKHLQAVALQINSPGGSPVQSSLIAQRIRALADEKEMPVIAFCEDVAASGGYWLACAADEIYADDASVIGSIGVISGGFGFPQLIKRLGIERRVHTAGENKNMLDPFLRETPEDVEKLKDLQLDIHDAFKEMVRERRGEKLKESEEKLFTGEFWTGRRALNFGLIDGLGELTSVLQERYGKKVQFRPVVRQKGWLRQKLGMAFGGGHGSSWLGSQSGFDRWTDDILTAIEERALWGRFGL